MATKLQKGVEAWWFSYSKGTTYIERIILQSMGKIQATATKRGEYIKCHITADRYGDLVAVADMADPTEYALKLAAEGKKMEIQRYAERAHWYIDAGDNYHIFQKQECQRLMDKEPQVHFCKSAQ